MDVADRADSVGVALNVIAVLIVLSGIGIAIWMWVHGAGQECYGNLNGAPSCVPVAGGNHDSAVVEFFSALFGGIVVCWFGYVLRVLVSIRRSLDGRGPANGPRPQPTMPAAPLPSYPPIPPFPGPAPR